MSTTTTTTITPTPANAPRPTHRIRRALVAAGAVIVVLLAGIGPAGAGVFDWLSDGTATVAEFTNKCFIGCSIETEGGATPCDVEVVIDDAATEVPTELRFRAWVGSGLSTHTSSAKSVAMTLDGAPITTLPGPTSGEWSAKRAFGIQQAGNHVLRVTMKMKAGYSCVVERDVWVHPKSWLALTAKPHPTKTKAVRVHAGLHVDWEDLTPKATFTWSLGGGKAVGGLGAWDTGPSDLSVAFTTPGPKTITVTASAMSRGRLVTLQRSVVVHIDGALPDTVAGDSVATTEPAGQAGTAPGSPVDSATPEPDPTDDLEGPNVAVVNDAPPQVSTDPVVAAIPDPCTPIAPTGAAATSVRGGTLLTWASQYVDGACVPVDFRLQVSVDPSFATPLLDVVTTKTLWSFATQSRSAPTAYWFRIAHVHDDGSTGPWTAPVAFVG